MSDIDTTQSPSFCVLWIFFKIYMEKRKKWEFFFSNCDKAGTFF